ncbi:MAG TPA: GNAT family protein [Fervidobacterium sp.]|nr:N-acetyltransferase [Fervidobacterium sp.]HOM74570.1 GNAT family protein [Fervidobacterium sp.]HOQ40195.1 GNAT family protein [Fervidobacterium sp.]HPT54328.1 GNAT family protein [Fervidobacterium sp.]HPZ18156.1 GNAT family protein [Fervidobacterium sp.]
MDECIGDFQKTLDFTVAHSTSIDISTADLIFFSERRIIKAEPIYLTFEHAGEEIGFVEFDLRVFNRNAYLTYYIVESFRGKGFGRAMLKKSIEYAFDEMNMHRLTAEVYEYNEKSVAILDSLGFSEEGRLKEAKFHNARFWDIIVYGILHDEWCDRK